MTSRFETLTFGFSNLPEWDADALLIWLPWLVALDILHVHQNRPRPYRRRRKKRRGPKEGGGREDQGMDSPGVRRVPGWRAEWSLHSVIPPEWSDNWWTKLITKAQVTLGVKGLMDSDDDDDDDVKDIPIFSCCCCHRLTMLFLASWIKGNSTQWSPLSRYTMNEDLHLF